MSTVLTKEAAQGFAAPAGVPCPYLYSSPCAMAWLLGRHMASAGMQHPTPEAHIRDASRVAVTAGRGDTLNVRGRCDILLGRFTWKRDNTFREVRS